MQQPFEKNNASMNVNKINGLQDGIIYGQNERVDELNNRITERFYPDSPLKPNFDPRAVSTKYAKFPIIDLRSEPKEKFQQYLDYSTETNFTPLGTAGPVDGYLNNVETESILRNQFFALQKGADQGVYVPSSNSDLYKVPVFSRPSVQPFMGLFDRPSFYTPERNVDVNIGNDRFNNHTRTQLRGSNVISADQM